MSTSARLNRILAQGRRVVHVSVERAQGSTPREAGASMLVLESGEIAGTIGGGALEWEAQRLAGKMFEKDAPSLMRHEMALGPELAQCCGGRMALRFELLTPADVARAAELAREADLTPLALFGAGHVGRALVLALAPLPFSIRWIDARATIFPDAVPGNVTKIAPLDPAGEIAGLAPNSFVLVMTHSHPLDLDIVARALVAGSFPFIGLIGSSTKRMRFEKRLAEAGVPGSAIAQLVCPVGIEGIEGKEPATIAASMAARLLIARERFLETCA